MARTSPESVLAVARTAFEICDQEDRALDQIQDHLDAGEDREALDGMRRYFCRYRSLRKPVNRENGNDRENNINTARAGALA
jgi:hypothetical protein